MRSTAALIITAVALAGLAVPAAAAPYGTTGPTASVSRTSAGSHGTFLFGFTGANPGDHIVIVIHSEPRVLATVIADANGDASVTVRPPSGFHGVHTLVGTDKETTLSASAQIRIGTFLIPGTSPSVSEWTENAAVIGVGVLAVVLFAAGGMLLFAGKRRRRTEEQPA